MGLLLPVTLERELHLGFWVRYGRCTTLVCLRIFSGLLVLEESD